MYGKSVIYNYYITMTSVKYKFCPSCGWRHEYSFAPPNFCTNCGTQMGVRAVAQEKEQKILTKPSISKKKQSNILKKMRAKTGSGEPTEPQDEEPENEESEYFSDVDELPDLDNIEADVELETEGAMFTFSPQGIIPKKFERRSFNGDDFVHDKKQSKKNA